MQNYALYFNEDKLKLVISSCKQGIYGECTDEVKQFNDCYFTCADRKKLRDKAKELREKWLKEASERVTAIENMKVTNRY